jgi:GNAT superfamily N-acetyltransferase
MPRRRTPRHRLICVIIQRAGFDDAARIARIHARSWFAGFAPIFGQELAGKAAAIRCSVEIWQSRLMRNANLLVSEHGFVQYVDAEIQRLYVEPEAWGGGLAGTLVAHALDEMAERPIVWSAQTEQAQRFYAKCGFSPTGGVRTVELLDGVMATDTELQHNR